MQLTEVVGLGDIGQGPGAHATLLEKQRVQRRKYQHHTRQVAGFDSLQNIQSVTARHHQVQNHQMNVLITEYYRRLSDAGGFMNPFETLPLKYQFDCGANHRMIVHNRH
ncbi:hypothetical protein D3C84_1086810 [compost metagenome]